MGKGFYGASHGLLEKEIVEIFHSPVEENACKPNRTERSDYTPCLKSEIFSDVTPFALHDKENRYGDRRHKQADRPLGKERHKYPYREKPAAFLIDYRVSPIWFSVNAQFVHAPEREQGQRDEHAHKHIHADHDGSTEEHDAGKKHHRHSHPVGN